MSRARIKKYLQIMTGVVNAPPIVEPGVEETLLGLKYNFGYSDLMLSVFMLSAFALLLKPSLKSNLIVTS